MWEPVTPLPSRLQEKSFLLTKVAIWLANLFTLQVLPSLLSLSLQLTSQGTQSQSPDTGKAVQLWLGALGTMLQEGAGGRWRQQWNGQKLKINVDRWQFLSSSYYMDKTRVKCSRYLSENINCLQDMKRFDLQQTWRAEGQVLQSSLLSR